jgi:hypothetical protein
MSKINRRVGLAGLGAVVVAASAVAVALAAGQGHGAAHDDPALRGRGACPVYDHQLLSSDVAGAAQSLVPTGAREVWLCRYSGVGLDPATARRLQAHRRTTDRTKVAELTDAFNALRPMVGVSSCPDDNGTQVIAIFARYRGTGAAADPVTIDLTGCKTTTNGHVVRMGTAPLVEQLMALTPTPR